MVFALIVSPDMKRLQCVAHNNDSIHSETRFCDIFYTDIK